MKVNIVINVVKKNWIETLFCNPEEDARNRERALKVERRRIKESIYKHTGKRI